MIGVGKYEIILGHWKASGSAGVKGSVSIGTGYSQPAGGQVKTPEKPDAAPMKSKKLFERA